MNYYPFHIGDYLSHTSHLDAIEDIAYRRMIDLYYLQEGPLSGDVSKIARLIRMREHEQAIATVLEEFFVQSERGWENERCNDELARMLEKQAKAQASAAASVAARKAKAERTLNERSTDVQQEESEGSATNTNTNTNSSDTDVSEASAPTPKKKQGSEDDHKAAHWMFERVQRINPAAKDPNWNTWANDIRLMREIDGRTHADICELFDWANRDSFWCGNVLCPAKLREKWDQLVVQRTSRPAPAKRPAAENFAGKNYGESRDL